MSKNIEPITRIEEDSLKALFVDDEPDLLEQAKLFLEKENENLEIETTNSGVKALSLARKKEYDAMISDYKMDGMNGIELLKEFRKEETVIPFIILTGKGDEDIAMKALNLGADRYFQKSDSPKSQFKLLADVVTQEVERKKLKEKHQRIQNLIENDLLDELYSVQEGLDKTRDNVRETISTLEKVSEKREKLSSRLQKIKQKVLANPK